MSSICHSAAHSIRGSSPHTRLGFLSQLGPDNITAANIWQVLSSNPTFNGLTTFSTIMSAGQGTSWNVDE